MQLIFSFFYMPTLVFRVSAQYDEVIKLRNEISKLEAQLKKMDVNKSPAQPQKHWKPNWHLLANK